MNWYGYDIFIICSETLSQLLDFKIQNPYYKKNISFTFDNNLFKA